MRTTPATPEEIGLAIRNALRDMLPAANIDRLFATLKRGYPELWRKLSYRWRLREIREDARAVAKMQVERRRKAQRTRPADDDGNGIAVTAPCGAQLVLRSQSELDDFAARRTDMEFWFGDGATVKSL